MNSLQIEYFLTVCKYMSFTEAAHALYVSQPAVSKQIAAMEKEIGLPLLDRTYRSLHLTQAGEIFRDAFTKIENIYVGAANEAKQLNAKSKGALRVGVPRGWVISKLLPPDLMGKMKVDYPNISCSIHHLTQDELYQRLEQNSLDAIFVYQSDAASERQSLGSAVIKAAALRLFYRGKQPMQQTDLTREMLEGETFYVCPEMERANTAERLRRFCNGLGFAPNIVNLPNIESAISTVEAGFGGMIVFDEMHKLSMNGRFQYIDLPIHIDICLTWRQDRQNQIAELFMNELHFYLNQ